MGADADVAVIGGGPGGAAAAITAAAAGLRVVVVESTAFPRPRPGETLHPGVEPVLARLGLDPGTLADAGYLRHPGVWLEQGGRRRFEAYGSDEKGPWLGFQAPRDDMDKRLLERAANRGAEIWQPCRARDVVAEGDLRNLVTDRGSIRARWIVDAGGGRHLLARRLRLALRTRSRPLVARYGYAVGVCSQLDTAPTFRVDRDGWTWTARVGVERYHWTRLSLIRRAKEPCAPPSHLATLQLGRTYGENVTWRHAERCAGDGFFLVGDAAGVLDPASAKGVLRALLSGMAAGHLMAGCHAGFISSAAAAHRYDGWMRSWFDADSDSLTAWYEEAGFSYSPSFHAHALLTNPRSHERSYARR